MAAPLRRGSTCPSAMSNYAVVKDPRRGKRQVETSRGRTKSALECVELCGSVAASGTFG
jgi:hypothetical protein